MSAAVGAIRTVDDVIQQLGLAPHPESGWYRETFRDARTLPDGQQARSLGDWTLCGCTVAPGFTFAGFEMAADGFEPGSGSPA